MDEQKVLLPNYTTGENCAEMWFQVKTNVGISYVGGVKNCDDPSPRASHLPVTGSTYTDMRHIHKPIYDTQTHTHTDT